MLKQLFPNFVAHSVAAQLERLIYNPPMLATPFSRPNLPTPKSYVHFHYVATRRHDVSPILRLGIVVRDSGQLYEVARNV